MNSSNTIHKSGNIRYRSFIFTEGLHPQLVTFRATSPKSVLSGEKLVFSSVTENVGNSYSSSTGVFTAPHKGLYLFSLNMCTDANTDARYGIKKSNSLLVSTRIIDEKRDACGAMTAPVALKKGDPVYAECIRNCTVDTNYGTESNTLSGILVNFEG